MHPRYRLPPITSVISFKNIVLQCHRSTISYKSTALFGHIINEIIVFYKNHIVYYFTIFKTQSSGPQITDIPFENIVTDHASRIRLVQFNPAAPPLFVPVMTVLLATSLCENITGLTPIKTPAEYAKLFWDCVKLCMIVLCSMIATPLFIHAGFCSQSIPPRRCNCIQNTRTTIGRDHIIDNPGIVKRAYTTRDCITIL